MGEHQDVWGARDGAGPSAVNGVVSRPSKPKLAVDADTSLPTPDAVGVVQVKVWLLGLSPTVWRCLLVLGTCTLRELHGIIQVTMGWEGIHPT